LSGSVNKVTLIGNLGDDPEIRIMQSGDKVCNLSIATSETWRSKETGEKNTRTQWHRVVVFNPGIVKVCEQYLKKGSKVYLSGSIETRSWDQDGQKRYATEIVLRPYGGEMVMLDGKSNGGQESGGSYYDTGKPDYNDIGDTEIPF
jgi:single-strand DNA-binding protein